jgi:hypothetical protein
MIRILNYHSSLPLFPAKQRVKVSESYEHDMTSKSVDKYSLLNSISFSPFLLPHAYNSIRIDSSSSLITNKKIYNASSHENIRESWMRLIIWNSFVLFSTLFASMNSFTLSFSSFSVASMNSFNSVFIMYFGVVNASYVCSKQVCT